MSAFGDNLRRERDLRGVSLAEISKATKISSRMLDAIETERFERLPGGVFNAAFVRQYARYLGLDEDKTVAEFTTACGSPKESESQQRDAAIGVLRQMVTAPPQYQTSAMNRLPLLIAAGLLAAGALGVGGWRIFRVVKDPPLITSAPPRPRTPVIAKTPAPAVVAPTPAPPAATETAAPAVPAATGVNLEIDSTARVTIRVSTDGRPEWFAVMQRGGHRTIKGDRTVQLTVDDAAALVVTKNGETMPPLGASGETKAITYRP